VYSISTYYPWPTKTAFKQKIVEAIMDVSDSGGSPDYIGTDGMLTEFGKQALCLVYLGGAGFRFFSE